MVAESTLIAAYVLAIDTVIAILVLVAGPRITERRVVPRVLDLFENELLPRLRQEAMTAAEARIQQAQQQLQGEAEAMQHAALDSAEKRIQESKAELRDMMRELGQQMAQAALQQAEARIESARQELQQQMAVQEHTSGRTAAQELAEKSVDSRKEYAMQQELFEATIMQLQPELAPIIVSSAKAILPKQWKEAVRLGPEALPSLFERLKAFVPGLAGGKPQSGRSSWS